MLLLSQAPSYHRRDKTSDKCLPLPLRRLFADFLRSPMSLDKIVQCLLQTYRPMAVQNNKMRIKHHFLIYNKRRFLVLFEVMSDT